MGAAHFSDKDESEVDDGVEEHLISVDPSHFTNPVAMSMSGGTASFFSLHCTASSGSMAGRSTTFWLGKDLERARDEVDFYNDMQTLDPTAYALLHRWAFRYAGVLTARCTINNGGRKVTEKVPRQLLVLENLRDGKAALRLLDIKLGEVTAVAGFKEKTWIDAMRQHCFIDKHTNSMWHGHRLEGFDNPPLALQSQLAGAPAGGCCPGEKIGKKHKRLILQRLTGEEFLRHWIDVADFHERCIVENKQASGERDNCLLPVEYSELILFDAVQKLARLCVDADSMPVPQMWIGSSLALCCEGQRLPHRRSVQEALSLDLQLPNSKGFASAYVFDWGRSELNTLEMHESLTDEERKERSTYWDFWRRGVLRVLYDAAKLYLKKFTHDLSECSLLVQVWDYDTVDPNDLVGSREIPLASTEGLESVEMDFSWGFAGLKKRGRVYYEIFESRYDPHGRELRLDPTGRLAKAFRVLVHSVEGLPCTTDFCSKSDPFVQIIVVGPNGQQLSKAETQVVWNQNDAVLDHHLDFAQVKLEVADDLLRRIGNQFQQPVDKSMLNGFEHFLSSIVMFENLARTESDDEWNFDAIGKTSSVKTVGGGVDEWEEDSD